MLRDRKIIQEIISDFGTLTPGDPTVIDRLETLVNDERIMALGWMLVDDCADLDKGKDPRQKEMTSMLKRALIELGN